MALLRASLWHRLHLIPTFARLSYDSFLTCYPASLFLFFLSLPGFLFMGGGCRSIISIFVHGDSTLTE